MSVISAFIQAIAYLWIIMNTPSAFGTSTYFNPAVSQPYTILDLQTNTSDLFKQQANQLESDAILGSNAYSTCGDTYLAGGYNILDISSYIYREYDNLVPHKSVYVTISIWAIDNWSFSNWLYVGVYGDSNNHAWDSYQDYGYLLNDPSTWTGYTCGNSTYKDLYPIIISIQAPHSDTLLGIEIDFSDSDTDPWRGQFGFRDIQIVFSNKTLSTDSTCGITTPFGLFQQGSPNRNCKCPLEQYWDTSSKSCKSCHSSCSTCFGSATAQCYNCASGYSYNGTNCIQCDSTCQSCFGTAANQCLTCHDSSYYNWEYKCVGSCASPYSSNKTNGTQYCNPPCQNLNYYYYSLNSSCYSTCSSPFTGSTADSVKFCTFPCNSTSYLYPDNVCRASCDSRFTAVNESGSLYCRYKCPSGKYMFSNGTCLSSSSCPSPFIQGTLFGVTTICNGPCSNSSYYYYPDNICRSSCDGRFVAITEGTYLYCRYKCSQYMLSNGTCISSSSCPSPFLQSTLFGVGTVCNGPCSNSTPYYYPDSLCRATCDTRFASKNIGGYLYCRYKCSSGQYMFINGTCFTVSSCPGSYKQVSLYGVSTVCNVGICPDSTPNYYPDGVCRSTCDSRFTVVDNTGDSYCSYPCSVGQYMFSNGTCFTASSCPSPYKQGSLYGVSTICNSPCSDPTPYYYPDTGLCQSTCPSSYSYDPKDLSLTCTVVLSAEDAKQVQSVSDVANAMGTATAAGTTVASTLFASDPSALVSASLIKLLQYNKYLNINYPPRLLAAFKAQNASSSITAKIGMELSDKTKSHFTDKPLSDNFSRYYLHSSFLLNFWDTLMYLLVILGIFILLSSIEKGIVATINEGKRPNLYRNAKKPRVVLQNMMMLNFGSAYGDIVLFFTLQFQNSIGNDIPSGVSFVLSIALLSTGLIFMATHFKLLRQYQVLKKVQTNIDVLKKFTHENEGLSGLFLTYIDRTLYDQAFYLFYLIRAILFNFIVGTLYDYPLAQSILIFILSCSISAYIVLRRPFRRRLDLAQQLIFEASLLVVSIAVLTMAIMDTKTNEVGVLKATLGDMIIYISLVLGFVPNAFIVMKIAILAYGFYKVWRDKKKGIVQPQVVNQTVNLSLSNPGSAKMGPIDTTLAFKQRKESMLITTNESGEKPKIKKRSVLDANHVIRKEIEAIPVAALPDVISPLNTSITALNKRKALRKSRTINNQNLISTSEVVVDTKNDDDSPGLKKMKTLQNTNKRKSRRWSPDNQTSITKDSLSPSPNNSAILSKSFLNTSKKRDPLINRSNTSIEVLKTNIEDNDNDTSMSELKKKAQAKLLESAIQRAHNPYPKLGLEPGRWSLETMVKEIKSRTLNKQKKKEFDI